MLVYHTMLQKQNPHSVIYLLILMERWNVSSTFVPEKNTIWTHILTQDKEYKVYSS